MTHTVTVIPADSDLLCEGCGYTLNGLPEGGNCPECGRGIELSLGTHRQYTEFEASPSVRTFFRTSWEVLVHPTAFYRTLIARTGEPHARRFAILHWLLASLLLGVAGQIHLRHLSGHAINPGPWGEPWFPLMLGCFVWFVLYWLTRLAARLSAWEAAFRGLRLPLAVVRRGMYYHAPHYLPVAGIVLATVVVDYYLLHVRHVARWQMAYLLVLCAEVVAGAVYLFIIYWIAMKSLMYANR